MLRVFSHGLHHRVLRVEVIGVDYKDHRRTGNRQPVQNQDTKGHHHGQNDRHLSKSCAADNAHADRPEQEHQIHRLLDSGTEADDGQRAHHAQRQHHAGLHGENQRRRDHGDTSQRDVEILGIERLPGHDPVDEKYVQRQQARHAQCRDHRQRGDLRGGEALQKGLFENIFEAHNSLLILYIFCTVRTWNMPSVLSRTVEDSGTGSPAGRRHI